MEFGVREFVEEVPVGVRRMTYGLTEKGRRMMELHARLSETGARTFCRSRPDTSSA